MNQKELKIRYSEAELIEFQDIIRTRLESTNAEILTIKNSLSRRNDSGTDETSGGGSRVLEDGAGTLEKESLSQSAGRLQKFATQLENALIRIKNGTYGVCKDTGILIPKDRLRAVPHTQQTIEAKLAKK